MIEKKFPKPVDKKFGASVELNGSKVIAARARTKVQEARNWAIRKAEELVKVEVAKTSGQNIVKIEWEMPERKVSVNGGIVFKQAKDSLRGEFCGLLQGLQLPL